jgi:CRP-like cAMP-binding protein
MSKNTGNRKTTEQYLTRYPLENMFSFPVRRFLNVRTIPKQGYLFRSDESANRLYFLVEGRAKTYVLHSNGNEAILAFPGPGTIMGDMELVGSITESYMVQAIEQCVAFELDLLACREQVLQDSKFLLLLCRLMGNKLYYKDVHLSAVKSFDLKTKLAEFILLTQTDGVFKEPLVQTAQYLGVSTRHLQRVLASFCTMGILKRVRNWFSILDQKALEGFMDNTHFSLGKDQGFLSFIL